MDRRGFLGAILASAVAPAIVRADSLMRIVPRETLVLQRFVVSFSSSELNLMPIDFLGRFQAAWGAELAQMVERDYWDAHVKRGDIITIGGVYARS